MATKRQTAPWKHIEGTGKGADRKYTARVQRAKARGQWTPPKQEPK